MNNIELVEYAKECLELGDNSVYVYGSYGNLLTEAFVNGKRSQYPNINTLERTIKYKKLADGKHYCFDCVGLIKSFYFGKIPNVKYDSNTDVSANGMFNASKVRGNISTMDKSRIGLLVQMDGHIGIYIGNDEVIECTISTNFAKQKHGLGGICKTKLSDRKWIHWCECPFIEYIDEPTPAPKKNFLPEKGYLCLGDSGDNVEALCNFYFSTFPAYAKTLKRNKKDLLGNFFGENCEAWTKEFQKRCKKDKLYDDEIDGCVGPKTYKCLQHFGFKYE